MVLGDPLAADASDPADQEPPSRRARTAIAAVLIVLLGASALRHLPAWGGAEELRPPGSAILGATGMEMDWILFAPNPPDRSTDVVVRITYDDGSVQEWRPPAIEPWLGPYTRYRYGKLVEFSTRGAHASWAAPQLLDSVVRIAKERSLHGMRPRVVSAELVVRTHPPDGDGEPMWTEEIVVTRTGPASP